VADPSLVAYVAARTGMRLEGAQQRRLSRVLSRACEESGMSAAAYTDLLRREQSAFDALADDLTVGETYFFRERPQLELLRDAVLEGSPGRPLRAWSAGCASGEEAYTAAMLLGTATAPHGVQVLGTDLSPTALARAERATYGARSLRAVTDAERRRWFEPGPRGQVRVRESVRRAVRFAPGNLLDGAPEQPRFDVVLCRNVLIYLSPDAVSRVAAALREALLPTGWLLTGVADPVLEADGLERVATPEGVMYRRVRRAAPASRRARPEPAPIPALPRVERLVRGATAPRPPAPAPPVPPWAPTPVPAPVPDAAPEAASEAASAAPGSLADVRAAVDASPLDAALRYRLAVLHLEVGDVRAAVEAATAAAFLDPSLVVAHLLLGRLHEALQDPRRAQRCFRTAAALLDQLPGHSPVPHADGETAESLARVVGAALSVPLPAGGRGR
jgi:chemotaxis protein methyltransferase CheR